MSSEKDYLDEKPWYSYMGGVYKGKYPAYFNPADYDWVKQSEAEFGPFKIALEKYLNQLGDNLQPYFLRTLPSKPGGWKITTFYFWGKRVNESCDAAPEVEAYLKKIPGLLSASVSWLDPQTNIAPHYGDSNAMFRCHLGISIPEPFPACGLEVNGEKRGWEEGKWLLFCDAHYHSAWNNTDKPRYIIIADVIHPHFEKRRREICMNVHSLLRLQQIEMRHAFVSKLPGKVRGIIRRICKLGFEMGLLQPRQR
ncbi:MAG: aspH [Bacteroidetes bacterium]|nr:MAG: aspH [Bacteroidota bacterium]